MNETGPSPTYRGYRRQALYVLSRVLLDVNASTQSYRPEGAEDLYVFDLTGALREAVQVKDYSTPLCLSDFEPKKRTSFFYRVRERLTATPGASNRLVSFGIFGPELENCLGQDGPKARQSATKLMRYQAEAGGKAETVSLLSQAEAERILRAIIPETVSEESLRTGLLDYLKLSSAGVASDVAFDLLLFWIFLASENATLLTRDGVVRKLQQISTALAALQSHHQEWGRTIIPLGDLLLTVEERDQLATSFREGTQAHWRHIVADLDIRREDRLAEMRTKLSQRRALIVHGASGQGKSTLAYRYLREFSADGWRFQVSTITGRDHALNICLALEAHAAALGIPVHVLIDVLPNDEGWTDIVGRLARHPAIKVILVVREEDFHRAHFDRSSADLEQIDLQALTETEARGLYDGLVGARPVAQFLSFTDAWQKFGGTGPLLEFTYLVQQGESLRERLRAQVERVRSEALKPDGAIRPQHLEFLALAAVASEYECRLRVTATCTYLGFTPLLDPIAPFEKEYLLRAFTQTGAVGGLHAIRSSLLVEHLFRAAPEKWGDYAKACLGLLLPGDLERFLLCAFSRRPEHANGLIAGLTQAQELSWTQIGGVTRALLWLGISRYEEENRALLDSVTKILGVGWWFVFGSLLTDRDPEREREFREVVKKIHPAMPLIMEKVIPTPKGNAFKVFRAWVESASNVAPPRPETPADWLGAGELSFWVGYLELQGVVRGKAEDIDLDSALEGLALRDLAAVLLGVAQLKMTGWSDWHQSRMGRLRQRFLRDTLSLALTIADTGVEVSFLIDSEEGSPKIEEQTMHRLRILRGLFPCAVAYRSQGRGYEGLPFEMASDPTKKEIKAEDFPVPYTVGINAIFIALVKYRYLRTLGWDRFVNEIMEGRRAMVAAHGAMERGIDRLLAKRTNHKLWDILVKKSDWLQGAVSVPELPAAAVDEWGFSSDGRSTETSVNDALTRRESAALTLYAGPLKAMNDYASSLGFFRGQFEDASHLCLLYRQIGSETDRAKLAAAHAVVMETEPKRRLALVNLIATRKQLPAFQEAFRRMFLHRVDTTVLSELEMQERRALEKIWPLCVQFLTQPTAELRNARILLTGAAERKRETFIKALQVELARIESDGFTARIETLDGTWNASGALWLSASVVDFGRFSAIPALIAGCLVAAVKQTGFGPWEAEPLQWAWGHVVIAPQIRGRCLSRAAFRLSAEQMFSSNPEASCRRVHEFAEAVIGNDWPATVATWDVPIAQLFVRWMETTINYSFHFMWLVHIFSAVADDESAIDALDGLIQKRCRQVSEFANPAAKAYKELYEFIESHSALREPDQVRMLLERLRTWGEAMFPHLDSEGLVTWTLTWTEFQARTVRMSAMVQNVSSLSSDILNHYLPSSN